VDVERIRRNRDASRQWLILGVILLFVLGAWANFGGEIASALVVGVMVLCGASILAWMYWGYRLRRLTDPWAYDPDVDGPDPSVRRGLEHAELEDAKDRP
jgi:hypothetical protein